MCTNARILLLAEINQSFKKSTNLYQQMTSWQNMLNPINQWSEFNQKW